MNPQKYAKAIVAVLGLAISMATALGLTHYHYVAIIIAVLTALGVYGVPNKTDLPPLTRSGNVR